MYKKQRFNPQTMTSYILNNLKKFLYARLLIICLLAAITIFGSTFLPHRAVPDTYKSKHSVSTISDTQQPELSSSMDKYVHKFAKQSILAIENSILPILKNPL